MKGLKIYKVNSLLSVHTVSCLLIVIVHAYFDLKYWQQKSVHKLTKVSKMSKTREYCLSLVVTIMYCLPSDSPALLRWIKYSRHFSLVNYIDIINIFSCFFDNFIGKLDVSLPLVTWKLLQSTVDIITNVTYHMLNKKKSRQL